MKIRQGFVSNSSTSSFLMYGVCLNDLEMDAYALQAEGEKHGITVEITPGDRLYIGRSWDEVKDDETGFEFKERTKSLVTAFFLDLGLEPPLAFGTHSEAWRDE